MLDIMQFAMKANNILANNIWEKFVDPSFWFKILSNTTLRFFFSSKSALSYNLYSPCYGDMEVSRLDPYNP